LTAVSKLSSKVKRNGGFRGSLVLVRKRTLLRANEKRKLEEYNQKQQTFLHKNMSQKKQKLKFR
jgi:hypothetical protein